MRYWLTFFVCCMLLASCASTQHDGEPARAENDTVLVATGVTLSLLPAASVLHDVTLTQRIDADYAPVAVHDGAQTAATAQSHSFIVQIEAGANEMRMVGLTPMGVQLFAVTLRGTELVVDVPAYLSLPFDPRYMLADMQLALADLTSLNAQLRGAQLRAYADGHQRELITSDGVRMRITYRGGSCDKDSEMQVEHLERHYQIRITTLSCDAL
jgi:hypothetical protein